MNDNIANSDMSEKLLADHEADGIHELDNDLPRWWVWLFLITIVWGCGYMVYYHVFDIGYLSADEYNVEIDPYYVKVSGERGEWSVFSGYRSVWYSPERERSSGMEQGKKLPRYVEETRETDTMTYVALTSPADMDAGRSIFVAKCVSCHGAKGEGGIGPNMTDNYWLHGAGMTNVVKSIKYGYPTKGMISWRGELSKEQMLQVATFILTLQGTNPPNQKSPQGELVQ